MFPASSTVIPPMYPLIPLPISHGNYPTKSCLLDPVPTLLLKDFVDILLSLITKLINLSLAEGVFPQKFKKAVVTPLIKKAINITESHGLVCVA